MVFGTVLSGNCRATGVLLRCKICVAAPLGSEQQIDSHSAQYQSVQSNNLTLSRRPFGFVRLGSSLIAYVENGSEGPLNLTTSMQSSEVESVTTYSTHTANPVEAIEETASGLC